MKKLIVTLFIMISFIYAENTQKPTNKSAEELRSEKQVLELKLEAYRLKKKLIEIEKFLEKERKEREERIEHEKAVEKFRYELRTKRKNITYNLPFSG